MKWLVISPDGLDVVQIVTSNSSKSYNLVYDWAIKEWKGESFAIVPFNDEHVRTIKIDSLPAPDSHGLGGVR